MQSADELLLLSLRQIPNAANILDGIENIDGIGSLKFMRLVDVLLSVAYPARSQLGIPTEETPEHTSHRFRICQQLADTLRDSGFKEDIGFNRFLYPSRQDLRDVLGFLAGSITHATPSLQEPSNAKQNTREANTPGHRMRQMLRKASSETRTPVDPSPHRTNALNRMTLGPKDYDINLEISSFSKLNVTQPSHEDESLNALYAEMERIDTETKADVSNLDELTRLVGEAKVQLKTTKLDYDAFLKNHSVERRALGILKQGDQGLKSLNEAVQVAERRLKELHSDWIEYKMPFEAELAEIKVREIQKETQFASTQMEIERLIPELETMREEHEALLEKYADYVAAKRTRKYQIPKRQEYIDKIFDLLNSIQQQDGIKARVSTDVHDLKRDISSLQKANSRRYVSIELLLNQQGIPTSFQQQCVSHLTKLKATFSQAIELCLELDQLQTQRRIQEEEVTLLAGERRIEQRFNDLVRDLNSVREDNRRLQALLKK